MILVNGKKVEFEFFPNGETRINHHQLIGLLSNHSYDTLTIKYENDSDLIKLMFVKNYLDRVLLGKKFCLNILYMPYSRMDRVEGNSAFTLKYVANFINSLKFDSVLILEPHSDVCLALIDNSISNYPTIDSLEYVLGLIEFDRSRDFLFFPDAGAQKRYHALKDFQTAVGFKQRDFKTGKITGFQVLGDTEKLVGSKVLILDDLCSYGGTFYGVDKETGNKYGAAHELKELGVEEVYLFVAHAEHSIFKGHVFNYGSPIKKVFATTSIVDHNIGFEDKLHLINVL